jgi:hypothetical protein
MTERIVSVVLGALTIIAAVAPWVWNRSDGLRNSIFKRLVISLLATIAVAYACLWTQADAHTHTITPSGKHAICGGGYLYMLDSRLERLEGFSHECIVQSRIAIAVILSVIIAIIGLEYLMLRRFINGGRQHIKTS